MDIRNHRLAGESATAYRARRRMVAKVIDQHLRVGLPALRSNKTDDEGRQFGYINGPHRSHGPHEVKAEGFVLSPLGVPTPHTFKVTHPGTLVKK